MNDYHRTYVTLAGEKWRVAQAYGGVRPTREILTELMSTPPSVDDMIDALVNDVNKQQQAAMQALEL